MTIERFEPRSPTVLVSKPSHPSQVGRENSWRLAAWRTVHRSSSSVPFSESSLVPLRQCLPIRLLSTKRRSIARAGSTPLLRLRPEYRSLPRSQCAHSSGVDYVTFDAESFRRLIQNLRPGLVVGAVVVAFGRIGLGGWRLRQVSEGRLSLWSGTRGQLAWDFFSRVTPSVMGGGPVAASYVARDEDLAVGESAALMFFCVLLDQLWYLVAIPLLVLATFIIDLLPDAAGVVGVWSLLAYFGGLLIWSALYAYATLIRPRLLV